MKIIKNTVLCIAIICVVMASYNIAHLKTREENVKTKSHKTKVLNTSDREEVVGNFKSKDLVHSEYIKGKAPLYVDGIVVVNKNYALPKNYKSEQESEALKAVDILIEAASEDGVNLQVRSGYRSYNTQSKTFKAYSKKDGVKEANTYSAYPGYSEHQTGLAFDFTDDYNDKTIGTWFDGSVEAEWLYNNAYKYGFILRYPEGKEDITGYMAESWHYRYVGKKHSKYFNKNNLTLEEYLNIH